MPKAPLTASASQIGQSIVILRGHRVILDADLAAIYGASTGRLNEAVSATLSAFLTTSCSASLQKSTPL